MSEYPWGPRDTRWREIPIAIYSTSPTTIPPKGAWHIDGGQGWTLCGYPITKHWWRAPAESENGGRRIGCRKCWWAENHPEDLEAFIG